MNIHQRIMHWGLDPQNSVQRWGLEDQVDLKGTDFSTDSSIDKLMANGILGGGVQSEEVVIGDGPKANISYPQLLPLWLFLHSASWLPWAPSSSTPFHHDVSASPQAQSSGADLPWTEPSETVRQNQSSSFKLFVSGTLSQQQKPNLIRHERKILAFPDFSRFLKYHTFSGALFWTKGSFPHTQKRTNLNWESLFAWPATFRCFGLLAQLLLHFAFEHLLHFTASKMGPTVILLRLNQCLLLILKRRGD